MVDVHSGVNSSLVVLELGKIVLDRRAVPLDDLLSSIGHLFLLADPEGEGMPHVGLVNSVHASTSEVAPHSSLEVHHHPHGYEDLALVSLADQFLLLKLQAKALDLIQQDNKRDQVLGSVLLDQGIYVLVHNRGSPLFEEVPPVQLHLTYLHLESISVLYQILGPFDVLVGHNAIVQLVDSGDLRNLGSKFHVVL